LNLGAADRVVRSLEQARALSRLARISLVSPVIDNSCGAVPLDRAGRPRPAALGRNQAKPDQGVGLRAGAPAPQEPTRPLSKLGRDRTLGGTPADMRAP